MTRLGVAVLGPISVSRDGDPVDLGTHRQRAVVAALAIAGGESVASATVIDRVWGDAAPATALATLHGYVASLRRLLEPDRPPRTPPTVLVTSDDGYLLRVAAEDRDEVRFEQLVTAARSRLEIVPDHLRPRIGPRDREVVETALDELDEALLLWRGTPYVELGDHPLAVAHRARLEDRHRLADELRAVGQLALGLHDVVRGELEARTAAYPLHERWWALRAVALARESRQSDALAVLDELREHLADELGVDPSPPLQELRTAILRQEPSVTDEPPRQPGALPVRTAASTEVSLAPWQLAGRDVDLAELRAVLDRAGSGRASFATLVGGAGIGKSRLVEELAHDAVGRGWRFVVGQCSQDDSAPPLWPWVSVLDSLEVPFAPPEPGLEAGGQFLVRADIARTIRDIGARQPLLLVLEDLHWADQSTLGVLRMLAETVTDERLLVVATWRPTQESEDLRAVTEALARRHAARRDLVGLDATSVAAVFEEVSGKALPSGRATELHRRTQGNPFFVVEFARLAASEHRTLDEVVEAGALPTAVADVVQQRFARLPATTVTVLRAAAVIGHSFDLDTLDDVLRLGADALLDAVEPALAAGVLEEEGVEAFRFSHALLADVLCSSMSATRLARTHELVAELLDGRAGREAEAAWHWRAAGPRHVTRAWRASVAAASAATRVYSYVDAAGLLETALDLLRSDAQAGPDLELELLAQAIDVYQWAAMRPDLVAAVERSIEIATSLGDVVLLARAAIQGTRQILWRSAPFGAVNEVVVTALRRAGEELPVGEPELRCRVLVSLANELRNETTLAERRRLCEKALAIARGLDDPGLVCEILLHQVIVTSVPSATADRLPATEEAIELARRVDDPQALITALALRTVVLNELGHVDEMWQQLAETRSAAEAVRAVYIELLCDEVELAWRAAAGEVERSDEILARIERRLELTSRTGRAGELSVDRTLDLFAVRLWQGRPLEALPELRARVAAGYPMQAFVVVALWRAGEHDQVLSELRPEELHAALDRELAFAVAVWCAVAEVALYTSDAELARHAYERLAPYAGRSSAPNGIVLGPVDAFLAAAACASGDVVAATRHADRADELIELWQVPRTRIWFQELRREHGF